MNISKISFGSTYKVNNQENGCDNFSAFQQFALNNEKNKNIFVKMQDSIKSKYPYNYNAELTMIVPDSMDNMVEAFCANRGIKFSKLSDDTLTSLNNISARIKKPSPYMKMVFVNPEKLEQIARGQDSNFEHCKKDFDKYYQDQINFMLKSGDEIPASTLHITSVSSQEDLLDYIKRYGADKLNSQQLIMDFSQKTDDPDHCMYFAFKDLGMNKIPVYVDKDTYQIADALGILD